jgi:NAD(P)-dependent dehydrogenase (short-subunit alcohol dehydrogenase family)
MQFHRQPFLQTSAQTLQEVWQSMVLTAFNVSQQAIPRLQAGGGGSLIFSGASGSLRAGPQFSAFSSAKFALRGLTQALVREHSDLAFLAHPSLAGARMAPVALLGRLFRALGADAVIFPNHGGR